MTAPHATFRLESPPAPGGVGLVSLQGDLDALLAAINIRPVAVGGVALRDLPGVGALVLARWSNTDAHFMPHGGLAQLQELRETLARAGATEEVEGVEAADRPQPPGHPSNHPIHPTDAALDRALARVASPRGVDLLLDQPRRWRDNLPNDPDIDRLLNRLIHPPLVAIIGPANIGKSTLVNALCDRAVSIVADQPGTTRDHVGVTVTLDGLTIRLVDCPGLRPTNDPIERRAIDLSTQVAQRADLIVWAFDPFTYGVEAPKALTAPDIPMLRVGLRTDLYDQAFPPDSMPPLLARLQRRFYKDSSHQLLTVPQKVGVRQLCVKIRKALVTDHALKKQVAWKFWD